MDPKGEQAAFVCTTCIQETPGRVWQGLTDPALMKRYWRHQRAGPKTFRSDWKKGSACEMAHDDAGLVVSGPGQGAQTLPPQGLVNRVIRGLLRSPLLCRLAGRRLITVYLAGRKSGRRYAVPVACTRRNGTLLVGTQFAWARNLRTGEPVHIRLAGKRRSADVQVAADETGLVEHFASMAVTTTSSPGSTRSASTSAATPAPATCTWHGPRAPGSPS
jgi:hypothetical protein